MFCTGQQAFSLSRIKHPGLSKKARNKEKSLSTEATMVKLLWKV
jgi:hypothetical protein